MQFIIIDLTRTSKEYRMPKEGRLESYNSSSAQFKHPYTLIRNSMLSFLLCSECFGQQPSVLPKQSWRVCI